MKWNKDYKLEIILSLLCAKWYISSHYINEEIGYFIFISIIAHPYIIYKLKCIFSRNSNSFKVNLMFYIAIIMLIVNSFSFLGISLFKIQNYQHGYFAFANITSMLKNITLGMFGILLIRNTFEFKLPIKVFAISNIAFGVETMFLVVIEICTNLNLFYYNYSTEMAKFISYTSLLFQMMIFGSLVVIFINAGTLREKFFKDGLFL